MQLVRNRCDKLDRGEDAYHMSTPGSYHLLRALDAFLAWISRAISVFLRETLLSGSSPSSAPFIGCGLDIVKSGKNCSDMRMFHSEVPSKESKCGCAFMLKRASPLRSGFSWSLMRKDEYGNCLLADSDSSLALT